LEIHPYEFNQVNFKNIMTKIGLFLQSYFLGN
jgi:hypothetical protein